MTTANPWSVKGVEPRTREAAKDLARREGLTLGEWLNRLVSDLEDETTMPQPQPYRDNTYRERPVYAEAEMPRGAYQLPPRPQREPDYGRFSRESEVVAVTSALDQLAHRLAQSDARNAQAISTVDDTVMTLGKRLDLTERSTQAAIGRVDATLQDLVATQTALSERLRRMDDGDAQAKSVGALRALENALTRLATQVYGNEDRTDAALSQFDARLVAAQTRADATLDQISQKVESSLANANSGINPDIAMRLERMEANFNGALAGVDDNFGSIAARLARMELGNPEAAISELRRSIDERMEAFSASLDSLLSKTRAEINRETEAHSDAQLAALAADLRAKLDASEARNAEALERVGSEVARAAEALDQRLRQVEHTDHDATLTIVRREITDISRSMDARLTLIERRESAAMEHVSEQIAQMSQKLDHRVVQSEERSARAIEQVGDQMVKLAETLQGRQEQAVATLTERLREADERAAQRMAEELARSEARANDIAAPLERSMDRLSDRIGRLESTGPMPLAEMVPMDPVSVHPAGPAAFEEMVPEADLDIFASPPSAKIEPAISAKAESVDLPDWALDDDLNFATPAKPKQDPVSFADPIFDDPFAEKPVAGGKPVDDLSASDADLFVTEAFETTTSPFSDPLPTTENSPADPFTGGFGEAGPPSRKGGRPDYLENARKAAEAAVAADAIRDEAKKTKAKAKPALESKVGKSGVMTMAVAGLAGASVLVGGYLLTRPKLEPVTVPGPAAKAPVAVPPALNTPAAPAPAASIASGATQTTASVVAPMVAASAVSAVPDVKAAPVSSAKAVVAPPAGPAAKVEAPRAVAKPAPTHSGQHASAGNKTSAVPPTAVAMPEPAVQRPAASAPRPSPVAATSIATPAPAPAPRPVANPSAPAPAPRAVASAATPPATFNRTPAATAPAPPPASTRPAPAAVPPALASVPQAAPPQTRSVPDTPTARPSAPTTPQAQMALADQRQRAGDKAGAAAALLRAAELGQVQAQIRIARIFEKGDGVPVDLGKARQWTQRAAEAGDRQSMHNLAVFYANGDGTNQDYAQAAKWFREAAQRGVADSQFNLGALSEQGLGVRKDIAEAYYWYSMAAKQGDKDAAQRAAQLEASLTPTARNAAKARVDSTRPAS